jgi:hypothetical protein
MKSVFNEFELVMKITQALNIYNDEIQITTKKYDANNAKV